ncbi:hypothetical protein EOD41_00785 [Mucilaginibacter limnophilus]|uniref:Tyr recombinase domain-containing protein n=1 Tax=Mucilaginibacter limnophilus TaxID=1932778 RepID=A0A437MXX2_9SPHI|nr:hypothetical protein [Mucilaginibacter limnophilus]RVU02508.1 hypothetical protein EOD41_00785 [Mucilaginibacter limnophilus]
MKHLIRLRKMTTLAFKLQWISIDPFKNYKFRYKKVETAFLSTNELQSLINYDLASETLQVIRDYFLFACYTGLSFVDLMNLDGVILFGARMGNGSNCSAKKVMSLPIYRFLRRLSNRE